MYRLFPAGAVVLLLGVLLLGAPPASAATPRLLFPCGVPQQAIVTCLLSGQGFVPHERVSITYRAGAKTPANAYRVTLYRRTTIADGRGSFTRPPLRFAVDPRVLAYKVTVTVQGARGDHAQITAFGTP